MHQPVMNGHGRLNSCSPRQQYHKAAGSFDETKTGFGFSSILTSPSSLFCTVRVFKLQRKLAQLQ